MLCPTQDTHYARPAYSLANTNAAQTIAGQYQNITALFAGIEEHLYYLADIFSPAYLQRYNKLFFSPLCTGASCSQYGLYGQDQGLNDLLFYYFDYAVGKYELYAGPPPPLASARSAATVQK